MPKYIRRSRTSSSTAEGNLRDVLLNELEKEGSKLLKKMMNEFSRDLEKEGTRVLQGLFTSESSGGGGTGKANASTPGLDSAAQLIGTLVGYAISRPKTSTRVSSSESTRSAEEAQRFRLSRSQAMIEASAALGNAERNS